MTTPSPPDDHNADDIDQIAEIFETLTIALGKIDDLANRIDAIEWTENHPWPTPETDLITWVDTWLNPTFRMDSLLGNWQTNPALTSELTALFKAYKDMTAPQATGWDALAWHRYRAEMEDRIRIHTQRNNGPTINWDTR